MIDRATLIRAFIALFVLAAIGAAISSVVSDTDGEQGRFLTDNRSYGPIFEEPGAYRKSLLDDAWVQRVPVAGGSTFGRTIEKQVRIEIDGSGPIPEREVTLQTPPAAAMFAGDQRNRAERVLHGMQIVLEDRGGLVSGISLTESRGGYEAAAISGIVEQRLLDGVLDRSEQRLITRMLREYAVELADHAFAWYDGRSQWIVFGPQISRQLLGFVRDPASVSPAQGIFAAYVVRHELEHAVTPRGTSGAERLQWVEEGVADTMARWPGAAAHTAKSLGLPYPRRYEREQYSTKLGGYPEWTATMQVLLAAARIDVRDPDAFDDASELLQGQRAELVPAALADAIGARHGMDDRQRARLAARIATLDGSPRAAKRLVASLR